ncbi:MAG: HEAT repeat domain-containing protein [Candidatus Paceibacterota bacterium]
MADTRIVWFVIGVLAVGNVCPGQTPERSESPVADWLRQLQHDDETISNSAAFAFDPVGVDPPEAADRLIAVLDHESPFVRRHVAVALGELAEPADVVVPALIGAFRDEDPRVRKFALASLLRLGAAATPYLASALADRTVIDEQKESWRFKNVLVADYAAFALSRVDGPIAPACFDVLRVQIDKEQANRRAADVDQLERRLAAVSQRLNNFLQPLPLEERGQLSDESADLSKRLSELLVADSYVRRVAIVINARGERDADSLLPLFANEQEPIQRMALLATGPESANAIPAVEKLLYGDNERLQEEALDSLQRIGQAAAPAIAKVMLDHPRAEIRLAAAERVVGTESAAEGLIEVLLHSKEETIRLAAARSLSNMFSKQGSSDENIAARSTALKPVELRVIDALAETLDDGARSLRLAAARGLSSMVRGPHPSLEPLVPKLIERMQDADDELKSILVSVLGQIGKDAAPALPVLLEELKSVEMATDGASPWMIAEWKRSLIRAIGAIEVRNKQVESDLLAVLPDAEQASRHAAVVEALGQMQVENAVPAILQFLSRTPDEYGDAHVAAKALLRIDPAGVEALTGLPFDQGQPPAVRQRACRLLAGSGSTDERVVKALLQAAVDPDAVIRLDAAHGLASRRLAGETAIPVFVQWLPYLNRSSGGLRKALNSLKAYPEPASAALVKLLPQFADVEARDQVAATLRELQQEDSRLMGTTSYLENLSREDAERFADGIEALAAIGIPNDQTVALAIKGLRHINPEVRRKAAVALRRLRPADPRVAVTALLEVLEQESRVMPGPVSAVDIGAVMMRGPHALDAVLQTLASYGSDASSAVPRLVELLADPAPSIRAEAATALGGIGVDTAEVRSKLLALMDDPNIRVYEAATQALLSIGLAPEMLGPRFAEKAIVEYLDKEFERIHRQLSRAHRPQPSLYHEYTDAEVVRLGGFGGYGGEESLPPFPWPPPRYTHRAAFGRDIPRRTLGEDDTTLGEIYNKLYQTLFSVDENFESGLFGVGDDGFALLAKLERIDDQGKPLPGGNRWFYGELPPLSFKDYIGRLFFEKPGYFRVLAFVVTPKTLIGYSDSRLPHTSEGASDLPDHIAGLKFKNCNCYILIYSFERRRGGSFKLYDKLGPKTHLLRSGILAALGSM